jgi:hypothetical protein
MRRLTFRLWLDEFPPDDPGHASCLRTLADWPAWEGMRARTVAAWFAIIH